MKNIIAWVDGSYKDDEVKVGGILVRAPTNDLIDCWYGTILKQQTPKGSTLAEFYAILEGIKRLSNHQDNKILIGDVGLLLDHGRSKRGDLKDLSKEIFKNAKRNHINLIHHFARWRYNINQRVAQRHLHAVHLLSRGELNTWLEWFVGKTKKMIKIDHEIRVECRGIVTCQN